MSAQSPSALHVVVTRARADARALTQDLSDAGFDVAAVPLLDLQDIPADQWQGDNEAVSRAQALMVVSARAAAALARDDVDLGANLRRAWANGAGPRVWAPGLGTVKALLAAGVPAAQIDSPPADAAQFDSEHLWPQVRAQLSPGKRVVFLRGEGAVGGAGRDFLWQRCLDAGAMPESLWVYRRGMPQWTPQERDDFARLRADAHVVWLFSSSLALQHWTAMNEAFEAHSSVAAEAVRACAVTTHPRITETAQNEGWQRVVETTPRRSDLIQTLRQLASPRPDVS